MHKHTQNQYRTRCINFVIVSKEPQQNVNEDDNNDSVPSSSQLSHRFVRMRACVLVYWFAMLRFAIQNSIAYIRLVGCLAACTLLAWFSVIKMICRAKCKSRHNFSFSPQDHNRQSVSL